MDPPFSFLIVHNVSKRHNVGTLLRTSAAFGVSEIWVVGNRKPATFGNQGTAKRFHFRFFTSLSALSAYAAQQDTSICGVEITMYSQNVWCTPFIRSTAFLLGNEGQGLTRAEKEICEFFLYIPQYSSNTESLNVATAGGIVLHHFARN